MEFDLEPPKLSQKAEPILVRFGLFQPKCAFPFLMGNGAFIIAVAFFASFPDKVAVV